MRRTSWYLDDVIYVVDACLFGWESYYQAETQSTANRPIRGSFGGWDKLCDKTCSSRVIFKSIILMWEYLALIIDGKQPFICTAMHGFNRRYFWQACTTNKFNGNCCFPLNFNTKRVKKELAPKRILTQTSSAVEYISCKIWFEGHSHHLQLRRTSPFFSRGIM